MNYVRLHLNVSYENSLWSTDSWLIAFDCLSNIRRTTECCLPRLSHTSIANIHSVLACSVRVLFAFRCKPGFKFQMFVFTLCLCNRWSYRKFFEAKIVPLEIYHEKDSTKIFITPTGGVLKRLKLRHFCNNTCRWEVTQMGTLFGYLWRLASLHRKNQNSAPPRQSFQVNRFWANLTGLGSTMVVCLLVLLKEGENVESNVFSHFSESRSI